MAKRTNPFRGKRRIVSSDVWEPDALDDLGPDPVSFGSE
jgi:hypothetical protein